MNKTKLHTTHLSTQVTNSKAIEIKVAQLWEQVLAIETIDPNDAFLHLGGNSSKAIQIAIGIERLLSIRIPVIAIFQHDTIKKLTDYLKNDKNQSAKIYKNTDSQCYYPLTSMQTSFYFLHKTQEKHNIAYHIPCVLDIKGPLNIQAMSQSFEALLKRHTVLQSIFYDNAQGFLQEHLTKENITISLTPELITPDQLNKKTLEAIHTPIPLNQLPLMKVKLFKTHDHTYRLVIIQPHIITDGWSLKILTEELLKIYDALVNHQSIRLPAIPVTYFDYVIQETNRQNHQEHVMSFWKAKLKGMQKLLLPYDYAPSKQANYSGKRHHFSISKTQLDQLNQHCHQYHVTPFMWVAATLNFILSRYCYQKDITIGFPHARRDYANLSQVIGALMNTLPLRTQISSEQTFSQLLKNVKADCLQAYEHGSVALQSLIKHLNIKRQSNQHPLFDVMLVWQDWYASYDLNLTKDLTIKHQIFDTETAKFDLTFEFMPTHSGLEGFIEYKTSLFHPDTIKRLAFHLVDLFNQSIDSPEKPLDHFAWHVSPETAAYFPKQQHSIPTKTLSMIHQGFEYQANQTPNDIALISASHQLTYADLNQKANQLAHYIQYHYSAQLKANTPCFIGIFLDKNKEVIISLLAILKLGAAYVPIDIRSPKKRLQFITQDASIPLTITQSTHVQAWEGVNQTLLDLDTEAVKIAKFSKENLVAIAHQLTDPMYVIYTSGTTGKPKGVIQTHQNVARLFQITEHLFHFKKDDTGLFFHSHAFDFSVWEIWASLLYGGKLIIPKKEEVLDPYLTTQLIKEHQITRLNQTPSAFQRSIPTFVQHTKDLTSVRTIVFGGEMLNTRLLTTWWDHFEENKPKMINMYGITETTVHTTYHLLLKKDLQRRESSNIGKPLDDMQIAIVDEHNHMLPIGFPGELLVSGQGLALGYLNRPTLTHEKFIQRLSPLTSQLVRCYRTGDLVRYLSDHTLEYLGRVDQQIQFKGYRIEVTAIELALKKYPDITQAAVAIKPCHDTSKLVAYYTLKSPKKHSLDAIKLRSFLEDHLPSYMLPNLFIKLDAIPLTLNMKTNYAALPSIETDNEVKTPHLSSMMTEPQQYLATIWENQLNLQSVGLYDNFFSLGGDSITALQVVNQAKSKGFLLNVNDIYQFQTVKSLAEHGWKYPSNAMLLKQQVSYQAFSGLLSVDKQQLPENAVDAYPMSALQLGMIYHSSHSPDQAVYLDVFSYWIQGTYHHEYFLQALQSISAAQPILRTTFHLNAYTKPLQIVHKSIPPKVILETITQDVHQQQKALKQWMEKQKKLTFNFEKEPLFHITIHILSDNTFHLGLSFHHAILDGWSVATLITTLLKSYRYACQNQPLQLSPSPSYGRFIEQEQQMITSKKQKQFWLQQLKDFEITDLWSWPKPALHQGTSDFLTHVIEIDTSLTQSLINLSKSLHVSLDALLLTSFIKLLSVLTQKQDILTGVLFNGRPAIKGIENTLGLFLNTLPFRHKLMPVSWEKLILSIAAQKTGLYPYRQYPLMQIQKDLKVNKLFDILFYFTHFHAYLNQDDTSNFPCHIIRQDFYERTNFPLTFHFSLNPKHQSLSLFIHYETKKYPTIQIKTFSNYIINILHDISKNSQACHESCDLMSPQEKQRLLIKWNQTTVHYDLSLPIHQFIELQAKSRAAHIAVQSKHQALTYEELIHQANHLAYTLKTKGAGANSPIVVYMPRTAEAVVAMIAVLKLGGIYIPIDIAQPLVRVNYILEDISSRWIISHSSISNKLKKELKDYTVIDVDVYDKSSINDQPIPCISYDTQHQDTTYILYTSGSTGKPKGVMVSQKSLLNFLFSMKKPLASNKDDRWLALTSFAFDISMLELLFPLFTGGTLVLATDEEQKDPFAIINLIKEQSINCLQATPTTWKMLLDVGYQLDDMMKVITAGEALKPEIAMQLAKAKLAYNAYGPTEATIFSTIFPLHKQSQLLSPIAIGKPITNTKAYVLNHHLQPQPIGVPGELFMAGEGVSQGYFKQTDLTQSYFIANPFCSQQQNDSTLYKTGDKVYWLPDGNIYFTGRADHQLKIRGFRLEAGEVESAILQHQAIKSCVVLVKPVNQIDCLVAYITLHDPSHAPELKALRHFLLTKLPAYMLPEKFVTLKAIPTSISGKTDIKALQALPMQTTIRQDDAHTRTLTPQERVIADIWCQVLSINAVKPDDDFFDLGGNSILSLIIIHRINQHFDINISIRLFIENPTLSALSETVSQHQTNSYQSSEEDQAFTLNVVKQIPNPMVILRKKKPGDLSPLFLIHPVGGTAFYYLPLVKRLTPNRPVYAIQDPGIMTKNRLFSSLSEMIDFYIKVIKRYQPHGPYYIAGSSFGANAAAEMARQLQNKNELVAFTGLIDGWAIYPDEANNNKQWFESNLSKQLHEMKTLLPKTHLTDLLIDIHWDRQQMLVQHQWPKHLPLNLTLFKAEDTMPVLKPLESPYNHWEDYCLTPPNTYQTPGNHFTMHFEPHIDKLADLFNQCLNHTQKLRKIYEQ